MNWLQRVLPKRTRDELRGPSGTFRPCQRRDFSTLTALGLFGALSLALLAPGCQPPAAAPRAADTAHPAPPVKSAVTGTPQPKLPTIKVFLGPAEVTAEQALRDDQIQTGMMFRSQMAETE